MRQHSNVAALLTLWLGVATCEAEAWKCSRVEQYSGGGSSPKSELQFVCSYQEHKVGTVNGSEFRCLSGDCMLALGLCNHVCDCDDESDEQNCEQPGNITGCWTDIENPTGNGFLINKDLQLIVNNQVISLEMISENKFAVKNDQSGKAGEYIDGQLRWGDGDVWIAAPLGACETQEITTTTAATTALTTITTITTTATTATSVTTTTTVSSTTEPTSPPTSTITTASSIAATTLTTSSSSTTTTTSTTKPFHIGHGEPPAASCIDGDACGCGVDQGHAGVSTSPLSKYRIPERGGTATLQVWLNSKPASWVSMVVVTSNVTVAVTLVSVVTFTPVNWATPQTITINAVDNDVEDPGDRVVFIFIANFTSGDQAYDQWGRVGTLVSGPLVVADDDEHDRDLEFAVTFVNPGGKGSTAHDTAGVSISRPSEFVINENGGQTAFSIVLSARPAANVTVQVSPSLVAAASISVSMLHFTPKSWNVPQNVIITAKNNAAVDPPGRMLGLLVSNLSSADPVFHHTHGKDVAVGAVKIIDDERSSHSESTEGGSLNDSIMDYPIKMYGSNGVAGVEVSAPSAYKMSRDGGSLTLSVRLTTRPSAEVSVSVSVSDARLAKPSERTLTFTPLTWDLPRILVVTAVPRTAFEQNSGQSVTVLLGNVTSVDSTYKSSPAAAAIGPIYIVNKQTSQAWSSVGGGNLSEFTVSLANATDAASRTVGMTFKGPSAHSISQHGGSAAVGVWLAAQPLAPVTIGVRVSNNKVATSSVSSLTFTSNTWRSKQTVSIGVVDGATKKDGSCVSLVFGNITTTDLSYALSVGKEFVLGPIFITETLPLQWQCSGCAIIFADRPSATMQWHDAGVAVSPLSTSRIGEHDGFATFGVWLTSKPLSEVTISVKTSNTSIATTSTLSLSFTPSTWHIPQTVFVRGVDNIAVDNTRLVTVILYELKTSDPTYGVVRLNAVLGPIRVIDDDHSSDANMSCGITVTPPKERAISEHGGKTNISVRLSSKPSARVKMFMRSSDTSIAHLSLAASTTNANAQVYVQQAPVSQPESRRLAHASVVPLAFTNKTWYTNQAVAIRAVDDDIFEPYGRRVGIIIEQIRSSDTACNQPQLEVVVGPLLVLDDEKSTSTGMTTTSTVTSSSSTFSSTTTQAPITTTTSSSSTLTQAPITTTIRNTTQAPITTPNIHDVPMPSLNETLACAQKDVGWDPMDMIGHPLTKEDNASACLRRCRMVPGCAHFAFFSPFSHCHLADAFATPEPARLGFISAPAGCVSGSGGHLDTVSTMLMRDNCLQNGISYAPWFEAGAELEAPPPLIVKNVIDCQRRCAEKTDEPPCQKFQYNVFTLVCHLMSSWPAGNPISADYLISGPPVCPGHVELNLTIENLAINKLNMAPDLKSLLEQTLLEETIRSTGRNLTGVQVHLHNESGRVAFHEFCTVEETEVKNNSIPQNESIRATISVDALEGLNFVTRQFHTTHRCQIRDHVTGRLQELQSSFAPVMHPDSDIYVSAVSPVMFVDPNDMAETMSAAVQGTGIIGGGSSVVATSCLLVALALGVSMSAATWRRYSRSRRGLAVAGSAVADTYDPFHEAPTSHIHQFLAGVGVEHDVLHFEARPLELMQAESNDVTDDSPRLM